MRVGIIGTGWVGGRELDIEPRSIHANVVGEHGDSDGRGVLLRRQRLGPAR